MYWRLSASVLQIYRQDVGLLSLDSWKATAQFVKQKRLEACWLDAAIVLESLFLKQRVEVICVQHRCFPLALPLPSMVFLQTLHLHPRRGYTFSPLCSPSFIITSFLPCPSSTSLSLISLQYFPLGEATSNAQNKGGMYQQSEGPPWQGQTQRRWFSASCTLQAYPASMSLSQQVKQVNIWSFASCCMVI